MFLLDFNQVETRWNFPTIASTIPLKRGDYLEDLSGQK